MVVWVVLICCVGRMQSGVVDSIGMYDARTAYLVDTENNMEGRREVRESSGEVLVCCDERHRR